MFERGDQPIKDVFERGDQPIIIYSFPFYYFKNIWVQIPLYSHTRVMLTAKRLDKLLEISVAY